MKKNFLLLLSVLTILWLNSCKHKDNKDLAAAENMEQTVEVTLPEVKTVTLTQAYPGNLQADSEVDIVARVNGVLRSHVVSGSKVKKGQVIYTIEASKYGDNVREAEASLATAQSNYEYYKKQYSAMQKAMQADAVSEIELLESKNNLDQSEASIRNSKAALDEARTMAGYCSIRAPFDGTIALHQYDDGTYISGEASPVTLNTIYKDDVINAFISVEEPMYARMMMNREKQHLSLDSVRISFNSPLQHTYYSKINYSAPDVSTSTGTVTLRFDIANSYGELKSGMYMNVILPYEIAENALLIRDASIGTDQLGKYVYVVNDSSKVVYTPIQVGELYADTLRIVTSGLTPDSRYVKNALLKVRNGEKVKVKE